MSDFRIWYEPREAKKYEDFPPSAQDKSCPRCRSTLSEYIAEYYRCTDTGEHVARNLRELVKCENCGQTYHKSIDLFVDRK